MTLVGAALHRQGSLPAEYATLASQAFNRASADLRMALGGKGYAIADLDNWDDAPTYVIQLALFHLLNIASALKQFPELKAAAADPTEMLSKAGFLIVSGKATAPQPGESEIGGVAFGGSTVIAAANRQYDAEIGGRGCHGTAGDCY